MALAVLVGTAGVTVKHRHDTDTAAAEQHRRTLEVCSGFTVTDAEWQLEDLEADMRLHLGLGVGTAERLAQYHLSEPPDEIATEVDVYRSTVLGLRPDVDLDRFGHIRDLRAAMAADRLTAWLRTHCPKPWEGD